MTDLLKQLMRKFDDADAGVAFRNVHGVDRAEWIAAQVKAGVSDGRARDRCRKMANEALVGHRLREQARANEIGRAYSEISERNQDR